MGIKEKAKEAKEKLCWKAEDAKRAVKNWCYNNQENLKKVAPFVISGAAIVAKNVYRDHRKNKERRESECEFYDFRDHQWYNSKRPLTGREKLEMEELNKAGVSKGEYLKRKRILK